MREQSFYLWIVMDPTFLSCLKDVPCPLPEKLVPEISSLLCEWWQNTAGRQLASELKGRKRKTEREKYVILHFPVGVCVYLASHQTPGLKDDCHDSFIQQSPGQNQSNPDPSHITLEAPHSHHNGADCENHPVIAKKRHTRNPKRIWHMAQNLWWCLSVLLAQEASVLFMTAPVE